MPKIEYTGFICPVCSSNHYSTHHNDLDIKIRVCSKCNFTFPVENDHKYFYRFSKEPIQEYLDRVKNLNNHIQKSLNT